MQDASVAAQEGRTARNGIKTYVFMEKSFVDSGVI
jgi:hypothetical protein